MRRLVLAVCISSVLCFVACGGGSGSYSGGGNGNGNAGNSSSTITSVTATCSPSSVFSGLTVTCTATVTGTGSYYSAVNWSATAGTITQAGVYTSPSVTTDTQVTITATAAYDTTKTGSTTVAVSAHTITGIQVSCSPGSPNPITSGQQSQCTAVVNGTVPEDQSVTWSATLNPLNNLSCNCISSTGVITAPQVPGFGQVTTTAISVADPSASGTSSIYVRSAGTITSVTASCPKTALNPGQDMLCIAVVTGTGGYSSAVQWAAVVGDVLPSGLYIASKVYTDYGDRIAASAAQDGSVNSTVTVTVTPSAATANNVVPVVVDGGPNVTTSSYVNGAFTSVTVCVPGTANCQTIDHVLVDTGSVGLRLLASGPAGGELNLPLPAYADQNTGNALVECAPFVSGFLWGTVVTADVYSLADGTGEQAPNIEMQVVGQPGQPSLPSTCSSSGADLSTLQSLGANGILGIGVFSDDCGFWCYGGWGNQYIYYSCSSSACSTTSTFDQVANPVSSFLSDNQGSLIQLPTPTTSGPLQGSLIFGINTQPNNQLGTATELPADSTGGVMTFYQTATYSGSFLDSGSNGLFFLNSQTLGTQMPACTDKAGWYCPATPQSFSIVNRGSTGGVDGSGPPAPATFSIGNADQLFQNSGNYAIPTLGGDWPLTPLVFDFGLPFFYGRPIFTMVGGTYHSSGGFAY